MIIILFFVVSIVENKFFAKLFRGNSNSDSITAIEVEKKTNLDDFKKNQGESYSYRTQ